MIHNPDDLDGRRLNAAVAMCCGGTDVVKRKTNLDGHETEFWVVLYPDGTFDYLGNLDFVNNWALSGPILDEVPGLHLKNWVDSQSNLRYQADIHNFNGSCVAFGHTLLVAALRCAVKHRLGDAVWLPEDLT